MGLKEAYEGLVHDLGKAIRRALISIANELGVSNKTLEEIKDGLRKNIKSKLTVIFEEYEKHSISIPNSVKQIIYQLVDQFISNLTKSLGNTRIVYIKHEDAGAIFIDVIDKYLEKIGLGEADISRTYVQLADTLSAGERAPIVGVLRDNIEKILMIGDWSSPFVSPLWIARIFIERYQDEKTKELLVKLKEGLDSLNQGKIKEAIEGIYSLYEELLEKEPFCIEPRILRWRDMIEWESNELDDYPKNYRFDALTNKRPYVPRQYIEIFLEFLVDIGFLLWLVTTNSICKYGFVKSLLSIYKKNFFFVPAAVYDTIVPDTSLYAHSKCTSALSTILSRGNKGFKLLFVDIRGIQRFIALTKRNKWASKIMRGKSVLIELMMHILAERLLLDLNLAPTNILIKHGGILLIAIPSDINDKIISSYIDSLNKEFYGICQLYFAISEQVTQKLSFTDLFIRDIQDALSKKDTIAYAIIDLSKKILMKRSAGENYENIVHNNFQTDYVICEILGVPVPSDEAIIIDEESEQLLQEILPDIRELKENYISLTALRCATLGHIIRNAKKIFMLYAKDEKSFETLRDIIANEIFGGYIILKDPQTGAMFSYVLFKSLKAIALIESFPQDSEKRDAWAPLYILLETLARHLRRDILRYIDIITVNMPEDFLPRPHPQIERGFLSTLAKLIEAGADIGYDFLFINTIHPTTDTRFSELDEIVVTRRYGPPLLGIGKMDVDRAGELLLTLASNLSRYITASELLQFFFGGLAYALTVSGHAIKRTTENGKIIRIEISDEPYCERLAILYSGGDDVAVYGNYVHVIHYLSRIRNAMKNVLHPLTASAGIVIDDPKYPIAILYRQTLELLDEKAKEFDKRDSFVIFSDAVIHASHKSDAEHTYGASYYELLETCEVVDYLKRYKSLLYSLLESSRKASESLEMMCKHNLTYDDILTNTLNTSVALVYRLKRHKKAFEELNRILEKLTKNLSQRFHIISDNMGRGNALEALTKLNTIHPILALIMTILRV